MKEIPRDVIRKPVLIDMGGGEAARNPIQNYHYPKELDGNKSWERQDDFGRLYLCTDRGTVYCFSPKGIVFWQFAVGTPIPPKPVFSLPDLIFPASNRLFCLRDGALRWTLPLRQCSSMLVDKDGTIFLSYVEEPAKPRPDSPNQAFPRTLMAAVDRDGHVLWRLDIHGLGPSFLDPAGRLYVRAGDSTLCLSA
jgi:outer membrane protein assembly factor BamB